MSVISVSMFSCESLSVTCEPTSPTDVITPEHTAKLSQAATTAAASYSNSCSSASSYCCCCYCCYYDYSSSGSGRGNGSSAQAITSTNTSTSTHAKVAAHSVFDRQEHCFCAVKILSLGRSLGAVPGPQGTKPCAARLLYGPPLYSNECKGAFSSISAFSLVGH